MHLLKKLKYKVLVKLNLLIKCSHLNIYNNDNYDYYEEADC